MLTPERLKEIKQRAERATPGPWTSLSDDRYRRRTMNIRAACHPRKPLVAQTATGARAGICGGRVYDNGEDYRHDNAEFIANAREDVPALVAEVERLWGLVIALRDELRWWRSRAAKIRRDSWIAGGDDASVARAEGRADGLTEAADKLEAILNQMGAKRDLG